jgi:P-type Ca2+ transporter type 2C
MNPDSREPALPWHSHAANTALETFSVDAAEGLSDTEVERRRRQYGPNELTDRGVKSPWVILLEQFKETMVIVLIVAAAISGVLGEVKDAIAILVIVILNAVLGFTQEYKAEQAMAALKKMASPVVKVRRSGHVRKIESQELVPGDIVLLEAGDAVPADGRLVESANLRVQEASLTGESTAVDKEVDSQAYETAPLGDRHNMVFMGTSVTMGRGGAVIVETGMRTQLGKIADMIQTVSSGPTPLQRRMARLGTSLAVVALFIVALVFGLGVLRGENPLEMALTGVAMAVAVVPEGLPAVVTIALALGAQRMLRRRALIRKLPAVETLGSVTTICSDKTGTLTENRMTVTLLDIAEQRVSLEQILRNERPVLRRGDVKPEPATATQAMLLAGGALCNDALLEPSEDVDGDFETIGDPTEAALVAAAARYGLWKNELEGSFPRVAEAPFTSERKLMSTVHGIPDGDSGLVVNPYMRQNLMAEGAQYLGITKGAIDQLLAISDRVWVKDRFERLDENWKQRLRDANAEMARDGLRVLGVAFRPLAELPGKEPEDIERELAIVGIIGMIDPPREEVKEAVAKCRAAGIRPVMITGDHPLTALRIAQDLGIVECEEANSDGCVITGQELSAMTPEQLDAQVRKVSVYARVSPEHKLQIVGALQRQGEVAAMTGDGVNDAPALRKADIGVAMGITGTDVSKEAADMIILDDNFATIVSAVEEGRTIYDNVRKFIRYTLTSNAGEIVVMLAAPFIGLPVPLTALQILWVNLVTDGLPGLALGVEPTERNAMRRPPYPPKQSILARGMAPAVLFIGLLMGLTSLGVGFWAYHSGHREAWVTMVFMTLTLSQMGNALTIRSERDSLFAIGLLSNKPMLFAVLLTFVLQLAVTYIPFLQPIFRTTSLSAGELGISLAASTSVFMAGEIWKLFLRRRD